MKADRYRVPVIRNSDSRRNPGARETSIMVAEETGLAWLVAAIFAALAVPPADTQHARFALPANRITEVASIAVSARPGVSPHSPAPAFLNTGPPAALSGLRA
jgi:hypothetical protein